jgi:hypothetical protein
MEDGDIYKSGYFFRTSEDFLPFCYIYFTRNTFFVELLPLFSLK